LTVLPLLPLRTELLLRICVAPRLSCEVRLLLLLRVALARFLLLLELLVVLLLQRCPVFAVLRLAISCFAACSPACSVAEVCRAAGAAAAAIRIQLGVGEPAGLALIVHGGAVAFGGVLV
jgi:hypothetical protein